MGNSIKWERGGFRGKLRQEKAALIAVKRETDWTSGSFFFFYIFRLSGFSGAGGGLAALWLACWATWRRAASPGWMRRSSEACLGRDRTKTSTRLKTRTRTRSRSGTRTRTRTGTGPGPAWKAWPHWTSHAGPDLLAPSWTTAAASLTVGNGFLFLQ